MLLLYINLPACSSNFLNPKTMVSSSRFLPFIVLLLGLVKISEASVGVNYGRLGNNLPSNPQVVGLLKSFHIRKVRIFDSDGSVLQAFRNSGLDVSVAVTNEELQAMAGSKQAAINWIESKILPYVSDVHITSIAVGNEVLTKNPELAQFLLPSLQNLHFALQRHGLEDAIKLSTPHAFDVISASSFPPSIAKFRDESAMKPLLDFLASTNSPLMINVYPFFSYASASTEISLQYALFEENFGVTDSKSGLHYGNLFDAMVDTVIFAMAALGHQGIPVMVTETGWPSLGTETGANLENASKYNNNLVKHLESMTGTPARPESSVDAYIFALFNENLKTGALSERNFGLFQPDQVEVYSINV